MYFEFLCFQKIVLNNQEFVFKVFIKIILLPGKYDSRTRAMILEMSKSLDIHWSLVEMMEESAVEFLIETKADKSEYACFEKTLF